MHIIFSIDTQFIAAQNSFCMKLRVWKAVYVAFTCIKTFKLDANYRRALGLSCQTEDSNAFDSYAVAIRKSANVIGHVIRKIFAACSPVVGVRLECLDTCESHVHSFPHAQLHTK